VVAGLSLGLGLAGLVSPLVGRLIDRFGGRPVLGVGAVLLALGLVALALAQGLASYLLAWILLGLGMGAGLYDPAFATLGRLYGQSARSAITSLTLFGGFASTVCWPLSAFLEAHFGWRETCIAYALLQLVFALPVHMLVLPRERATSAAPSAQVANTPAETPAAPNGAAMFILLASVITISSVVSTVMSVHLLGVLQDRGFALAAAVGLGALVGPSQVGARAIEMAVARFHHPIWTKLVSTSCVVLGLGLLWIGISLPAVALVFYGAGIGLESIARGTLPLAIFGPAKYPIIMGRIARPSLLAQAIAPTLAAVLAGALSPQGMLAVVLLTAICNLALSLVLFAWLRR
jgi:predicted MFS family arabinose efflux permease